MAEKIIQQSKTYFTKEKNKSPEPYYPLYFILTGLMFVIVLMVSAINNYLFFGWLCISMAIIMGLMFMHLLDKNQVKRS